MPLASLLCRLAVLLEDYRLFFELVLVLEECLLSLLVSAIHLIDRIEDSVEIGLDDLFLEICLIPVNFRLNFDQRQPEHFASVCQLISLGLHPLQLL